MPRVLYNRCRMVRSSNRGFREYPRARGCAITGRAVEPMRKPSQAEESTESAVERDSSPGQPRNDEDSARAAAGLPGEDASRYCPVCSHRLESKRCKLVCTVCGYYMSCADYY